MAESRKTVTIVFTDVTGSTALGEQTDPETMRRIMERYFEEMRAVLERHGGTVEKFIGDAVMAVFGIPTVHEDDALRAVRAAAEMRDRLAALNKEFSERGISIAVRTGVNTGEVIAGDPADGQTFATGDAVNVAARLEQAAQPGEILLGELTRRLVGEAVRADAVERLELKGKAGPVAAWQLADVIPGVPAFTRRINTPFVGRGAELTALRSAYERARDTGSCELVTVFGAAGIGKSRLVRELVAAVADEARVVVGRCLSYGEGITYWPLAEIIRQVAGADPRSGLAERLAGEPDAAVAAERLLAAVGATDEAARTEEIFWATRLLLERMARDRPLVVVVDDVHWAEETLLDLIEYVTGFTRAPVLVACTARPDLYDTRPHWPRAGAVELEALGDEDADALIEALLVSTDVEAAVRETIKERAEGNPLFVEQMLALAAENGHAEIAVPATIQALLAARLDHLPAEERSVLVRGAVEGRLFHRGAVSALLPEEDREDVPRRLLSLARKAFVRPDEALFPGDDAFRFAHALVRDAAYDAAPKELRAELHERFAGWLEETAPERISELEEILGYHLEQAFRYRRSLGEAADELARRAGEHLARAGDRALDRGDVDAAQNLLGRACELLPGETARAAVALSLAEALVEAGHPADGAAVLSRAAGWARMAHSERLETLIALRLEELAIELDPASNLDGILSFAREAIDEATPARDHAVLAAAWQAIQAVEWFRGDLAAARAAAEEAIPHAQRLGNIRLEADLRSKIDAAGFFGREPLSRSMADTRAFLEWAETNGALAYQGAALHALGELTIEKRRLEEGVRLRMRGWQILDELGMSVWRATLQGAAGALPGERTVAADAVLARIRDSYETLRAAGNKAFLSTVASNLAVVLYDLGEYDQAERLSHESEQLGAAEDVVTQTGWRAARAMVIARRGAFAEAESAAREAVERASSTEYSLSIADAYLSLAEVLRLAGRSEEARGALQEALAIYEQKELLLSADAVRKRLAELQSSGSPSQ